MSPLIGSTVYARRPFTGHHGVAIKAELPATRLWGWDGQVAKVRCRTGDKLVPIYPGSGDKQAQELCKKTTEN